MGEQKYKDFFENVRKFKQEQNKQKQRGLNDFNILTTVLKYHDEVRVHSRMIGAFLDINGKHYQDSLFLEKFLAEIKITNYDFKNSKLYLEYENIDLYLTDGLNHIIIENKIWAKDQDAQIKRYIDAIQKENDNVSIENLYVVYLSIDRKQPSDYSLDTLNIKGDYIVNKSKKIARFININYKNEILNWLEECQYEVQNITNLNEAIKQYTDVVKMIINQYEGKVMNLKNLLKKDREKFKLAQEISKAYEQADIEIKLETQEVFWKYLQEKLQNKGFNFDFVSGDYSKVDIDNKVNNYWNKKNKTYHFGLKYNVKNIDVNYKLSFFIEINHNIYYGFTISKDENRNNFTQNKECEEISVKVLENRLLLKPI